MRLIDQLTNHPLFDERPIKDVFDPLGFEVHIEQQESPGPDDAPEDHDRFLDDPNTYMDALEFSVPEGFTELDRFETEDAEIVMLAVKPVSRLALAMMTPLDEAQKPNAAEES